MFVHNNSKHGRRAKRLDPDGSSAGNLGALSGHPLAPDSTYDGRFLISFCSQNVLENVSVWFSACYASFVQILAQQNVSPVKVFEAAASVD
jgi:hypothetical protein